MNNLKLYTEINKLIYNLQIQLFYYEFKEYLFRNRKINEILNK
jgi:hypothetical protein